MNVGSCSKQLARLIDDRRARGSRSAAPSAPTEPRIADGEGDAIGRRVCALDPTGDRAQIERDEDAEHQQHEHLGDGLEQPETEDCQDRRRQDGAELEAPRRRRARARQLSMVLLLARDVLDLGVHFFFVELAGAERLLLRRAGREHAHLLLEREELHVDAAGGGALFELLEVLRERDRR